MESEDRENTFTPEEVARVLALREDAEGSAAEFRKLVRKETATCVVGFIFNLMVMGLNGYLYHLTGNAFHIFLVVFHYLLLVGMGVLFFRSVLPHRRTVKLIYQALDVAGNLVDNALKGPRN